MMLSPTPGSKNPVYPGVNRRSSPKISSPYEFNAPSGQGPTDDGAPKGYAPKQGTSPMPGETRGDYQRRMQGKDNNEQFTMPSYPAPYPPTGEPSRSYSPSDSGVNTPAKQKLLEKARASTIPDASGGGMKSLQVEFKSAHDRIQRALQSRDYDAVSRETAALQQQLEILKSNSAGLEVNERFTVTSMSHWADEAVTNLQEGSSTREDAKVEIGLQNLEKAANAAGTPASKSSGQP
jgi:hypothetical protein